MHAGMRLGVMATLDDYPSIHRLDLDFVEILLRDGDPLPVLDALLEREETDLIVHAPERMTVDGRSELIDLADDDPDRREAFADHIGEVVSVATRHGAATVIHPGGVRRAPVDRKRLKRNLTDSLSTIEGIIWMENMPRRYHCGQELLCCNLLTSPEEFDDILPYVDGVTLDISHAYLSVDKGGNAAIASFFSHLRGHLRHVHLSDASYPHNEGLQLGTGDVDLTSLPRMDRLPVLLEVWGGHLDGCAGYKEALRRVRSEERWFRGCIA